jgi:hypothetical protein
MNSEDERPADDEGRRDALQAWDDLVNSEYPERDLSTGRYPVTALLEAVADQMRSLTLALRLMAFELRVLPAELPWLSESERQARVRMGGVLRVEADHLEETMRVLKSVVLVADEWSHEP